MTHHHLKILMIAILLARAPELFITKYMPQLLNHQQEGETTNNSKATCLIDISAVIPYTTLRQLLRFWYIADFAPPLDEASLLSRHIEGLSLDESSGSLQTEVFTKISQEIKTLENTLDTPLLPAVTDKQQWIADLKRMLDEKIATDVVVNIFHVPNNNNSNNNTATDNVSFPAHRFILASQSPYFYNVFCTEFREASTSSVHMPSDLFTSSTLQVILYYLYTDTLIIPPPPPSPTRGSSSSSSSKLNEKKHELRLLLKVFTAADFLGHYNTICKAALVRMSVICHQFKCVCSDCSILLPSMLLFSDKHEKYLAQLRSKLISLYADPLDSLAPLWSQKPFAILVASISSSSSSSSFSQQQQQQASAHPPMTATKDGAAAAQVISQIFNSQPTTGTTIPVESSTTATTTTTTTSDVASSAAGVTTPMTNLIEEITEKTFANITKHNSVRVLHSLHLCLSYLRGADPLPTWSQATLNILNKFLHSTVDMIASNFDYYCVEYPILLSCVDGIGFGFSVDFLGFVLKRVLTEGMHDGNAAVLYQGIVRDLGGRQEMVRNVAVDSVLMDARAQAAQYIAKRWMNIKAEHGFATMDKEIMRLIAEGK